MKLSDLLEKRMSPRAYQKVFGRLGDVALIGFEIETLVPPSSPLHAAKKVSTRDTVSVNSLGPDDIKDHFDISRFDLITIDRAYGTWVAELEDEFVGDRYQDYMDDVSTEKEARRMASRDFITPSRDDWFRKEFKTPLSFVHDFGLEPIHGWHDEDQVYTSEDDPSNDYAVGLLQTKQRVAEKMKTSLGLDVKYIKPQSSDYSSWKIVQDTSIKDDDGTDIDNEMQSYGLEIISPPLKANTAFAELQRILKFIDDQEMQTNSSTGLHINISIPDAMKDLDVVKLVLFMGDMHTLEVFDRSTNAFTSSQMKRIIDSIEADVLPSKIEDIQDLAKKALTLSGKYSSVNLRNLPAYLEFRVAGGAGYHRRLDDIQEVMGRWLSALEIATDPAAEKQEYIKKLVKLLDKTAARREKETQQDLTAEQWFAKYNSDAYSILRAALAKGDKDSVAKAYVQLLNTLNVRWTAKRVELNFSWRKQVREMMKQHGMNLDRIYAAVKGPTDWLDRLAKELRLPN